MEQMVWESSDTTKKRLLSSQLKEFVDGMGIERGEQTEIATGGRPLPVTVGLKRRDRVKPAPFLVMSLS